MIKFMTNVDWVQRQEEHREKEWVLRCKLIHVAETAIERWLAKPDRCGSLEGIARLLDLASRLGRLSSGLPTDKTEVTGQVEAKLELEWEIALRKAYGEPEGEFGAGQKGSVVDVEVEGVAAEKERAGAGVSTN
jgi:hypothetical protein